jgi:hypothetical protein
MVKPMTGTLANSWEVAEERIVNNIPMCAYNNEVKDLQELSYSTLTTLDESRI